MVLMLKSSLKNKMTVFKKSLSYNLTYHSKSFFVNIPINNISNFEQFISPKEHIYASKIIKPLFPH